MRRCGGAEMGNVVVSSGISDMKNVRMGDVG